MAERFGWDAARFAWLSVGQRCRKGL